MAGSNEVLLVRHGETDENAADRFQGQIDSRLNERGREQSHALARTLAGEGLRALYTSPLRRARETAQIVGTALGVEPVPDARLVEVDAGAWSGRLVAEIVAEDARAFARWRAVDAAFRIPGGESVAEQAARVAAALADVAAGPLPALVVTHGGSIRAVLASIERGALGGHVGVERPPAGEVANCALFRLTALTPAPSRP